MGPNFFSLPSSSYENINLLNLLEPEKRKKFELKGSIIGSKRPIITINFYSDFG